MRGAASHAEQRPHNPLEAHGFANGRRYILKTLERSTGRHCPFGKSPFPAMKRVIFNGGWEPQHTVSGSWPDMCPVHQDARSGTAMH